MRKQLSSKYFTTVDNYCFFLLQSPKYSYKVLAHQYNPFYLMCFKECAKSHQIVLRYNETSA